MRERVQLLAPVEDSRTLWVDTDEHGVRIKEWKSVCAESWQEPLRTIEVDGPGRALHLCKHMYRFGGDPRRWLAGFLNDTGLTKQDRVYHELVTLTEALMVAGTYDQLNMGGVACLEKITRLKKICFPGSKVGRV